MTRRLLYWVLMLIWLLFGLAWHFAIFGAFAVWGLALIPFLLFVIIGWQLFGPPVSG